MSNLVEFVGPPEGLAREGAEWTVREIYQQPELILETQKTVTENRPKLDRFVTPYLADRRARIILAGAGTSAYIGDALAPMLTEKLGRPIESLATTDLLASPLSYLDPNVPTLIISFGRSGNSPESSGVVSVANAVVPDCKHLLVTCNEDGSMNKIGLGSSNAQVLLLPEATHDRSFAMTSSYTSMMYAAFAIFAPHFEEHSQTAEQISASMCEVLGFETVARAIAARGFDRFVYLGSHGFTGLAQEAALKMLELTDGQTIATHESTLGFRHGPKTIITDKTMIVVFVSNDPYTRQYDIDLINELLADDRFGDFLVVTASECPDVPSQYVLKVPNCEHHDDLALLFPYIVPAQLVALHQSLYARMTPDQPNATGTVNRVVQGVRVHPLT